MPSETMEGRIFSTEGTERAVSRKKNGVLGRFRGRCRDALMDVRSIRRQVGS